MFIVSVRASTLKFCGTLLAGIILVTVLVAVLPSGSAGNAPVKEVVRYDNIESYEDMSEFLMEYGWKASAQPEKDEEVVIPGQFVGVFAEYNRLQKTQGFDLESYAGKQVHRVEFRIENFDKKQEPTLAVLFVYRERIVGGHLCSADPFGFVCALDGSGLD